MYIFVIVILINTPTIMKKILITILLLICSIFMHRGIDVNAYSVFQNDCNSKNDSIRSGSLASALCGSYTIGGTNSDFSSFTEAVSILTVAGITCPVNFKVASGVYIILLSNDDGSETATAKLAIVN